MFDKDTARGWIDDIPVPSDALGQQLRRAVWNYLVYAADEDGRVQIMLRQVAEGLATPDRRPPSFRGVKASMAWLRRVGLVAITEAAIGHEGANTFQLATTPPPAARPKPPRPRPSDRPSDRLAGPDRPARAETDPAITAATAWLAEDLADEHLAEDIAHWVAGIWAVRDGGPGWVETACQVRPELDRLPAHGRRHYTRGLIAGLRGEGWLCYTRDEGSLAVGPRLKTRHQVAATARHSTGVADRGF